MANIKDEMRAIFTGKTAKTEFNEKTRELIARTETGNYSIIIPERDDKNVPFEDFDKALNYALGNLHYGNARIKTSYRDSFDELKTKVTTKAYAWLVEHRDKLELVLMERQWVRQYNVAPREYKKLFPLYNEFKDVEGDCSKYMGSYSFNGMQLALELLERSRIKLRLPATLKVVHGNAICTLSDGTIVSEKPIKATNDEQQGSHFWFFFFDENENIKVA